MATLRRQLLTFRRHTAAAGSGYFRILRTRRWIDLRRRKITANRDRRRLTCFLYRDADPRFLEGALDSWVRRRTLADVYDHEFRVSNSREIDYLSVDYPSRVLISCPLHLRWRPFMRIRLAAHAREFDFTFLGLIVGRRPR